MQVLATGFQLLTPAGTARGLVALRLVKGEGVAEVACTKGR
mgnify:CR=1 FL=1